MTDFYLNLLVGIGVVLFASLFIYALNLGYRLFGQAKERERLSNQVQEHMLLKDVEARQAIQVIARALLQNDLSDTEAAMRISFLSQQVAATSEEIESFSIFQQLAEATSHIPILEDWIALERTEKRRLNVERENIEAGFREFIRSSATELSKLRIE
jgi:hypothetical protein